MIPSLALQFLTGGLDFREVGEVTTSALLWQVVSQLVTTLVYPLLYCALTVAYYDLRVRKEGFDLELLEQTLSHALPHGPTADVRDFSNPRPY
jgi:hypothetical protein